MKAVPLLLAVTLAGLAAGISPAAAQGAATTTNPPPARPVAPAQPALAPLAGVTNVVVDPIEDGTRVAPPRLPTLESPPPIPTAPARYGGLIGQVTETERPLQLFNPLAPASYGDGTQNLSANPLTGRGEGLSLFSFQFKSKSAVRKTKSKPRPDRSR